MFIPVFSMLFWLGTLVPRIGQGHGHRAQHPQGSQGDAKHAAERMRDQDGDAQADDWHETREAAQDEAKGPQTDRA